MPTGFYLPENLHIEHCMKMVDLFSLTLRVIVYIPNLHAGGEARQVKAEKKRERGVVGGMRDVLEKVPPKKQQHCWKIAHKIISSNHFNHFHFISSNGNKTLTVSNISQNVASFCKKLENARKQMVIIAPYLMLFPVRRA